VTTKKETVFVLLIGTIVSHFTIAAFLTIMS